MNASVQSINLTPTRINSDAFKDKAEQISKLVQNWVVAPVCGFSALTGTASYLLPNYFNSENESVYKAAFWSAKAAILTNAAFGGFENFCNKNTFGTIGYVSDFVTSLIANEKNMYTLRGIGSALDQIPGLLEVLAKHPKIQKKYGLTDETKSKFTKYKKFGECSEKTFEGIKIVLSDLVSDFQNIYKEKGLIPALITPFTKAEKNLLISSAGILSGVIVAFVPGLFEWGAKIRDAFGLQADFAVIHKACADKQRKSFFPYLLSGIFYTIGTSLDFIFRWTEKTNLNLAAIGSDRLGAFLMALGNAMDNRDVRDTSPSESEPQFATAM